jgi:hypothetical protein
MHGGGALSAYPRGNGGVTEWEWWGDEVVWAFVERAPNVASEDLW